MGDIIRFPTPEGSRKGLGVSASVERRRSRTRHLCHIIHYKGGFYPDTPENATLCGVLASGSREETDFVEVFTVASDLGFRNLPSPDRVKELVTQWRQSGALAGVFQRHDGEGA